MSEASTQPGEPRHPPHLQPSRRVLGLGLLVVVAVLVAAVFGWRWVEGKTGEWAIQAGRKYVATAGVDTGLRTAIDAELDELERMHVDEGLGAQYVTAAVRNLLESTVVPTGAVLAVTPRLVAAEGLDETQRAEVADALEAFARAVHRGSVSRDEIAPVLDPVTARLTRDDGRDLKDPLAAVDVLKVADRARLRADEGSTEEPGEEPWPPDLAAEARAAIDAILSQLPADGAG